MEINYTLVVQIITAWFPCMVMFLIIPSSLYFRNKDSFDRYSIIVYSFCGIFIASASITSFVLLLADHFRSVLVNVFFYLGVFLLIKDSLIPVKLKDFKNGVNHENIEYSSDLLKIELLLAMVLVLTAVVWPVRMWEKTAGGFVLFILCLELFTLIKKRGDWLMTRKKKVKRSPPPVEKPDGGNIYHIVLDSYFNPLLVEYLKIKGIQTETLDGFTYFTENLSNYDHTYPSVSSFMTGSLYKEGENLKDFKDKWLSGGVMGKLYEKGYTLSQYVLGDDWTHEKTTFACFPNDGKLTNMRDILLNFMDVWLLRIVPAYFRKKVFSLKNGGYLGVISAKYITEDITRKNIQNNLPLSSVQLFNRLINDEKNRPPTGQYVHAHLYFPHMPYIYSAEGQIGEQTNMVEQTFYATKLLERFLDTLKEQGKYHNAIIIIHSDHGVSINGGVGNLYLSHCTPPIPNITLNQLRALLLIKKAGISKRPLCASQVVSQLADIPMTLGEMAGLDWETEVGKDIFKVHREAQREIPAYLGYHTEKGDFGQAVFKGTMQHICYDTKSGWGRKSDIEAVWEAN